MRVFHLPSCDSNNRKKVTSADFVETAGADYYQQLLNIQKQEDVTAGEHRATNSTTVVNVPIATRTFD